MKYFTFSWGNNYIAIRGLLQAIGHELATPPKISSAIAERGIELAHPFLCFSGKLVVGQIAAQIEQGDRRFAFMSSLGPEACRCADTCDYLQSLFSNYPGLSSHRLGGGTVDGTLANLRSHFGPQVRRIDCMKAYAAFLGKIDLLHKVEKRCTSLRCLSSTPKQVRDLEKAALDRIDNASNPIALWKVSRWFDRKANSLPLHKRPPSLRIGIIGGEHILSEVDSIMTMIKEIAERGILLEWRSGFRHLVRAQSSLGPAKEKSRAYLNDALSTSEVFSCAHALEFIEEDYDGLLHIYAFGCMPQTSVKPILQRVAQDAGVPLLSLSIGDRFAEEGLENRLEAFTDLLEARKNKGASK
jgi:hypothetical protein